MFHRSGPGRAKARSSMVLRDQSLFACVCMWGGGGKIMGWARPIVFREKEWAKREFHDGWGWVIVRFVKNHTHYNSCGRSK